MSNNLEILIADDHELFRRTLRTFIEAQTHWHVCAEAGDGVEAVEKAKLIHPDVVLMDINMPRRTYVDSELASELIQNALPRRAGSAGESRELLSERELQVLKLVAEGFSSREIAQQIFISVKTVETYRGRFAEKLGLTSRADIVRYALETGLLAPEKFSQPKRG